MTVTETTETRASTKVGDPKNGAIIHKSISRLQAWWKWSKVTDVCTKYDRCLPVWDSSAPERKPFVIKTYDKRWPYNKNKNKYKNDYQSR